MRLQAAKQAAKQAATATNCQRFAQDRALQPLQPNSTLPIYGRHRAGPPDLTHH
jgi:hypothetical protein